MGDIGRQGHLSQLVQDLLKDPVVFKLDQAVALLHNVNDLAGQKSLAEIDSGSDLAFFSRFDQGLPDIVFFSLEQKNLDLCLSAFLHAIQSGRNYFCIVDDKAVTRS